MAQRRTKDLQKVLDSPMLGWAVFGNVAIAVFVALGLVASTAFGATPLVFLAGGAVFLLTALTYVEGIAALPQAGGSSNFARRAFNELVSFFAGWALLLDYLITVAIAAFFAGEYLAMLPGMGWLDHESRQLAFGVALIAVVTLVDMRDVRAAVRISVVVSIVALVAQVALGVIGVIVLFDVDTLHQAVRREHWPGWHGVLLAVPISMLGFTGIEFVANLSGELRRDKPSSPRPVLRNAAASVAVLLLMSVLAILAFPVGHPGVYALGAEGQFHTSPILGIVDQLGAPAWATHVLEWTFGLIALAVLFVVANSSIAGMARLTYSMAKHRQIPSALTKLDRDTGTPRRAIALFGVLAAALFLLASELRGSAIELAQLYAFGALLSFAIAHASVIWLRMREPELQRPYRAPIQLIAFGRELPVTAVLGLVACLGLWVLVLDTHSATLTVGTIWMVAGFVIYAAYRFSHGLSLTTRYDPHQEVVAPAHAAGYRKVLLAVRPIASPAGAAPIDAEATMLAERLVEAGGEVVAMVVHELPLTQPLGAPLGDIEDQTISRLATMRQLVTRDRDGDGYVPPIRTTMTRARAAGRAICREAERRGVDAVLLVSVSRRRHADAVFGRTTEFVLRHAPCDVIVLRLPAVAAPGREARRRARLAAGSSAPATIATPPTHPGPTTPTGGKE